MRFGSSTPKPHDKTGYVMVEDEPEPEGKFEGISSLMGKKGSYNFDPSLHEDNPVQPFRYQSWAKIIYSYRQYKIRKPEKFELPKVRKP